VRQRDLARLRMACRLTCTPAPRERAFAEQMSERGMKAIFGVTKRHDDEHRGFWTRSIGTAYEIKLNS
jgi:hypothetical protein